MEATKSWSNLAISAIGAPDSNCKAMVLKILFPKVVLSMSLNLLTISKFILDGFLRKTALLIAMLAKRKTARIVLFILLSI